MKIIGQEKILNNLDFKGPYIIVGPKGSGKTLLAEEIALKLICENGTGCRECNKCKTFLHGNYPDYHYLSGGKIEEVREIIRKISVKPYYKKHIVIFDDFDKMTIAAQNSLLKTIEEPVQDILFILVGTKTNKILKTIFSRCYKISPVLLDRKTIKEKLKEKYPEENEEIINFAIRYSYGSLGAAINVIEKKYFYLMLKEDAENIKEKNFFEMANRYAKDYKNETFDILDFYEKFIKDLMVENVKKNKNNAALYNVLKQLLKFKMQLNNNINKNIMFQNFINLLQKVI